MKLSLGDVVDTSYLSGASYDLYMNITCYCEALVLCSTRLKSVNVFFVNNECRLCQPVTNPRHYLWCHCLG